MLVCQRDGEVLGVDPFHCLILELGPRLRGGDKMGRE
jgi:hypothetical protein